MLFWVLAALLTLGACLAVLAPLLRRRDRAAPDREYDLEVYRDQLAELERDVARGTLPASDAEQARAEIARRILRVAEQGDDGHGARASGRLVRVAATAAVLLVPVASWGIYAATGSPHLPGQPLQARLAKSPGDSSLSELVSRAEAHLAQNPSDGRGWDVLAPIYFATGRYADSVTAYRNAIRLLGQNAAREIGLGEALVAASDGVVTAEAQDAFERALEIEPAEPKARYLLAVAYAQGGRTDEAARMWHDMLADLPEESPWRGAVEAALQDAAGETAGPPGPSEEDVAAAASMAPDERAAMIETMVANLDAKLRDDPDDAEGWRRLVRSYVVLGRKAEALDALARGLAALETDSAGAEQLAALAASLGLNSEGQP